MDLLSKKYLSWHENLTNKWIEQFGISEYQTLWFAWFKGLIVMLILHMDILKRTILFIGILTIPMFSTDDNQITILQEG